MAYYDADFGQATATDTAKAVRDLVREHMLTKDVRFALTNFVRNSCAVKGAYVSAFGWLPKIRKGYFRDSKAGRVAAYWLPRVVEYLSPRYQCVPFFVANPREGSKIYWCTRHDRRAEHAPEIDHAAVIAQSHSQARAEAATLFGGKRSDWSVTIRQPRRVELPNCEEDYGI